MKSASDLNDEELRNLFHYIISTKSLELDEHGQLTKESVKWFKEVNGCYPWEDFDAITRTSEGSWNLADVTREYLDRFFAEDLGKVPAKSQQIPATKLARPPGRPSRAKKAANVRKTIRFTDEEIEELEKLREPNESFGEMVRRLLGIG